jgi:hypothetical protein
LGTGANSAECATAALACGGVTVAPDEASSAVAAEDARQTTNSPRQIACRLRNARGRYAPADMQLIDAQPINSKEQRPSDHENRTVSNLS